MSSSSKNDVALAKLLSSVVIVPSKCKTEANPILSSVSWYLARTSSPTSSAADKHFLWKRNEAREATIGNTSVSDWQFAIDEVSSEVNSIEVCLHIIGVGWYLLEQDIGSTEADRDSITEEDDTDRVVAIECINSLVPGSVASDNELDASWMAEEAIISEFTDERLGLGFQNDFLVSREEMEASPATNVD